MGLRTRRILVLGALLGTAIAAGETLADDANQQQNLVKQANAPVSSILQVRLQDTYQPEFSDVAGNGNIFSIAVTMPLPKYRLLPLPQVSLLTYPAAVTIPGGVTGSGDLKFLDLAVFRPSEALIWGVGPTFVFPVSSRPETGQGKWQGGPAAAIVFFPEKLLLGMLVQNPISFAGESDRRDVNYMILTPFFSYQFDKGWFVRSQPQIFLNWRNGKQLIPLDLGVGRVFKVGRQNLSCYLEPSWNISHDGPAPKYSIAFGISLLYPNFWQEKSKLQ
jgi:hypothetical protein